jgi:type I restriction enzyme M protein
MGRCRARQDAGGTEGRAHGNHAKRGRGKECRDLAKHGKNGRKNGGAAHANGNGSAKGEALLPMSAPADQLLDIPTLETWLWDAACAIRGAMDATKFKDCTLPLVFYKRLSHVLGGSFHCA